jgi:(2S)-methylsuccinyl-CoA dehydrogenase
VPAENLLGGVEGQGFRQLMQTFESARIQTAARGGRGSRNPRSTSAFAMRRARPVRRPLIAFPRVADKIALMAVEVHIARQLTYFAGRAKDEGRRCDLEAGMAKLLAARIAWSAADNALQIHGGNGFALEYPVSRVLCDARILSIFEGAAEIQAQVIARRLSKASDLRFSRGREREQDDASVAERWGVQARPEPLTRSRRSATDLSPSYGERQKAATS